METAKTSIFRDEYHGIEILHVFDGVDVDSSDGCISLSAAPARDPYILLLPHFQTEGGFLVIDKKGLEKIVEFLNKVIKGSG